MQGTATQLLKPRLVDVRPVGDNSAKITIEPLDRGFGHTLGNALRRGNERGSGTVQQEITFIKRATQVRAALGRNPQLGKPI